MNHHHQQHHQAGQRALLPFEEYAVPAMPTEHALRRYWRLARLHFKLDKPEPIRTRDKLRRATLGMLDSVAAPPACGPLVQELDACAKRWQQDAQADEAWLQVVVLPPCDTGNLLAAWAKREQHAVLLPPPRDLLTQTAPQIDWQLLAGDGLLVVPQLERWLLRRSDGLVTVQALIGALGHLRRPCIVGCNSWAWAYLQQAASIELVLPSPVTFSAFHARDLREWFKGLAQRDAQAAAVIWHGALGPHQDATGDDSNSVAAATQASAPQQKTKRAADAMASAAADVDDNAAPGQPLVFRLSTSGADVLADKSDDEHDHNAHDPHSPHDTGYLRRLAARSLGIPWVAWHLWRESLRDAADAEAIPDKVKRTVKHDGRTLWVSPLPEFTLPAWHENSALLVMHALLLHGSLTLKQLFSVLPFIEDPAVVAALHTAGFIEWKAQDSIGDSETGSTAPELPDPSERELHLRACAYPAARVALKTAGFPTGVI